MWLSPTGLPQQHGGSPSEDVVVKNGKHSGMLALLVRDEATGGLHWQNQSNLNRPSVLTVGNC